MADLNNGDENDNSHDPKPNSEDGSSPREIGIPMADNPVLEALGGSLVPQDQILPHNLFVIPVSNPVPFPTLMAPILLNIPRFVATAEEAINRQRILGLIMAREPEIKDGLGFPQMYQYGVVVKILKRIKLPDGSINLLVHSMRRFLVKKVLSESPHLIAEVEYLDDEVVRDTELDALSRSVIADVKKLSEANPFFTDEMRIAMINAPGPGSVADIVAFALSLPREDAQSFLEILPVKERFEKLLVHLKREQDVAEVQRKIHNEVNTKLNTMQREFFLKEQLKIIKQELGLEEDGKEKTSRSFRERLDALPLAEVIKKAAYDELQKFETLSEQSPEYNISRTYLETFCTLPWGNITEDHLDLERAHQILEEDHYGMEKVKERIEEFLAVKKLREARGTQADGKGSILCLVGPPGVGKTSIGKSIARTMGRNFYRFSLGGLRDEAEIKGHRRTYVGAMPGKFIQAMKRAGSMNPVILLDEIDKLSQSYHGDPASALLEVLDPEQNYSFIDHYLDVPFDLSQVLFVATANSLSSIPEPLIDRMEIIEVSGYTLEEKEKIANKYVIPKVLKKMGIKPVELKIEKKALKTLMADYAREPGLRVLEQMVEKIARKSALKMVRGHKEKTIGPIIVREDDLFAYLGAKRYWNELAERIQHPGVVVGLAWTSLGGDILFIESTYLPGNGALKLTGKMGEVMTESAGIAWTYVKKRFCAENDVTQEYFKDKDFHLHIPAGAIPKDGPSAGVTMASCLYSLLTGRRAKQKVAMTGELSLTGKVLPVGGIREKILAAKRAGISRVILPFLNQKDLAELPAYVLEGIEIYFARTIEEVFDQVLEEKASTPKVKGPLPKSAISSKKGSLLVPSAKKKAKAIPNHRLSKKSAPKKPSRASKN